MTQKEINFACESITELLDCAEEMLTLKKPAFTDGDQQSERGIYGLSITILIACAFDAMGNIGLHFFNKTTNKKNRIRNTNSNRFDYIKIHFLKGNNYGFKNDTFTKVFYQKYRCGLVHAGTLATGFSLENNEKEKIVYDAKQKVIHVQALVQMAKEIFEKLKIKHRLSSTSGQFMNPNTTGDTQSVHNTFNA